MNLSIVPELARRAIAQPVSGHRPAARTGPPLIADAPLTSRAAAARTAIADAFIDEPAASFAEASEGNGPKLDHSLGIGKTALQQLFNFDQKLNHGAISLAKKIRGFSQFIASKIGHGLKAGGKTLSNMMKVLTQRIGHGGIAFAKKIRGISQGIASTIGRGLKAGRNTLKVLNQRIGHGGIALAKKAGRGLKKIGSALKHLF